MEMIKVFTFAMLFRREELELHSKLLQQYNSATYNTKSRELHSVCAEASKLEQDNDTLSFYSVRSVS